MLIRISALAALLLLAGPARGQDDAAEAHRLAREAFRPLVPAAPLWDDGFGNYVVPYGPYAPLYLTAPQPLGRKEIWLSPRVSVSVPIYGDEPAGVLTPQAPANPLFVDSLAVPPPPEAPPQPASPQPPDAESFTDQALVALRLGQLAAALAAADQAVAQDTQFGYARIVRCQIRFALARFDEAADDLRASVQLLPADLWTPLVAGYAHTFGPDPLQSGRRYVTYLQALESATRAQPEAIAPRLLLGYHYGANGFSDAAVRHLTRVLELDPDDAAAGKLLARFQALPPRPAAPARERTF